MCHVGQTPVRVCLGLCQVGQRGALGRLSRKSGGLGGRRAGDLGRLVASWGLLGPSWGPENVVIDA